MEDSLMSVLVSEREKQRETLTSNDDFLLRFINQNGDVQILCVATSQHVLICQRDEPQFLYCVVRIRDWMFSQRVKSARDKRVERGKGELGLDSRSSRTKTSLSL